MVRVIYRVVPVEFAGGASFAIEVVRRHFIFVATAAAHGTWCCIGNVRVPKWAIFAGDVFAVDSAVVVDVFASWTEVAGNIDTDVCLGLVVTGGTNLTVYSLDVDENSPRWACIAIGVAGT